MRLEAERSSQAPLVQPVATGTRNLRAPMAVAGFLAVLTVGLVLGQLTDPGEDDPAATEPTVVAPPVTTTPTPTTEPQPTTTTQAPIRLEAFYPDIQVENGIASLRVEFVDGSWADIEWPEELQLLGGGVTVGGWARMVDGGHSDFFIRQGTVEYVINAMTHWGDLTLAREIPDGRGGMVGRWNSSPGGVHLLSFQFGDWAVLAPSLSLWNTGEWATRLRGETTDTGFLRLYADEPLSLGDTNVTLSGSVEFTPGECDPDFGHDVSRWTSTAQWCDESGLMYIYVSTSVFDFQLEIYEGLVIKEVYIAPGNR